MTSLMCIGMLFLTSVEAMRQRSDKGEEQGDLQNCTVDGEVTWAKTQATEAIPTSWLRVDTDVTLSVLRHFTLLGSFERADDVSGEVTVSSIEYVAGSETSGVTQGAKKWKTGTKLTVKFTATGAVLSDTDGRVTMAFNRAKATDVVADSATDETEGSDIEDAADSDVEEEMTSKTAEKFAVQVLLTKLQGAIAGPKPTVSVKIGRTKIFTMTNFGDHTTLVDLDEGKKIRIKVHGKRGAKDKFRIEKSTDADGSRTEVFPLEGNWMVILRSFPMQTYTGNEASMDEWMASAN